MTDQELRDFAADHLYYELTMLHETAMRLKHEPKLLTDPILKSALIESLTVHARVLALFLYYPPKRRNDVTAEQYVSAVSRWRSERGALTPDLQENIDRTGREIAHLTTARYSPGDPRKLWSFDRVYLALVRPLRLFLQHTPHDRLDAGTIAFINALPTPPGAAAT